MKYDESNIDINNLGSEQLEQLNGLLNGIVNSLEQGRDDIFDISEECRKQVEQYKVELLEVQMETAKIIEQVDYYTKLEKQARLRLMEVSRNFRAYTEASIKDAYDNAKQLQIKLMEMRNSELYLRKRRDILGLQIKQFEHIVDRADNFLNTTSLALKLLKGNVESISDTIEDFRRKQNMRMWIIESQESERRKIARELHDGPAQSLASALIRLDLINQLWDEGAERIVTELAAVKNMGQESLADIRRLMFDLKPTLVHDEGLTATLQEYFYDYEAKYNFNINYMIFGFRRKYDISLEIALYRLVQEALTNIRKHAGVNEAWVKIEDKGDLLTLLIKDEGEGFALSDVQEKQESYGILGMRERVELFGGEIDIVSSPGKGTQVIAKVPIMEEAGRYGKGKGNNSR